MLIEGVSVHWSRKKPQLQSPFIPKAPTENFIQHILNNKSCLELTCGTEMRRHHCNYKLQKRKEFKETSKIHRKHARYRRNMQENQFTYFFLIMPNICDHFEEGAAVLLSECKSTSEDALLVANNFWNAIFLHT